MRTVRLSNKAFGACWAVLNDQAQAVRLAGLVRQALIAEAELTPKPGLVDRRGAGAHIDLSLAGHEAFRLSDRTVPLPDGVCLPQTSS